MHNKLGKDAAMLTMAKVITMLISLVSSMSLSRFCTLEEYGTYSQLVMVITLATSLFTLGLPNSINYFLGRSDSHNERRQFLSIYYTLSTVLCVIMGVVLAILTPLIVKYFDNDEIRNFIYILAVLPWTMVIIGSVSNVLVVYGQTKKLTLFNVINALIAVVAVVAVELFNGSFQQYMMVYLIGECIMMLWVYLMMSKLEGPIRPSFNSFIVKEIFKFSIPIGLAGLVGTLTLECDKLIIGKIFDTETLAIYTNAAKELPVTIIATSLTAVLLPQMARRLKDNKTREAVELWKTSVELSYIFMAFVATALIVFAPQIMTILYSEKYLPGINIFRIYSAVLLLRVTYFGMVLNASGKTKFILYSSILTLVANAVLDVALYYLIGVLGPAIATFISICVVQILQLKATSKLVKIKFREIFPWKRIMIHTGINAIWGGISLIIIHILNLGVTAKEIIYCIVGGIFIVVAYIFVERKCVVQLWKELNADESSQNKSLATD